ncbi:MAG: hypothetical protein LBT04_03765, partial [Prevotellaceae bacterium]|nr:hypothetical protein [Prevotellaceae bacterium]
ARKIEGEKIFIALDADEIFTSNFTTTDDWQKIVNAKAGDIFNFRWAWIGADKKHCQIQQEGWSQWAFYDDGSEPELGKIHVARVPWPKKSTPREFFVTDFFVMHFPYVNVSREISKQKFYQCFIRITEKKWDNIVRLHRGYYRAGKVEYYKDEMPDYFFSEYKKLGIDIFSLLNLNEPYFWQDVRVLEYFEKYGIKHFQKLDIFDNEYLQKLSKIAGYEIKDPRNFANKLLHFYLRKTQKYKHTFFIKNIDKVLKRLM